MFSHITRDELRQKIDRKEDFKLVEALPTKEFEDAHLPGAINIPADRVSALAPRMLPDKDAEIVVYCASTDCNAAEKAATALTGMGYTQVAHFQGGKKDWMEAGFPTESPRHVTA